MKHLEKADINLMSDVTRLMKMKLSKVMKEPLDDQAKCFMCTSMSFITVMEQLNVNVSTVKLN